MLPPSHLRVRRRQLAAAVAPGAGVGASAGRMPCSTSTSRLCWTSRLKTMTVRMPSAMASGTCVMAKMPRNLTNDSTMPPVAAGHASASCPGGDDIGRPVGDGSGEEDGPGQPQTAEHTEAAVGDERPDQRHREDVGAERRQAAVRQDNRLGTARRWSRAPPWSSVRRGWRRARRRSGASSYR